MQRNAPLTPRSSDSGEPGLPILARGLAKHYGALTAVAGIDFQVEPGECVGFLGPNGAGKTTTVRMLSCFTPIGAGSVHIFGLEVARRPRAVKALLGICPQEDTGPERAPEPVGVRALLRPAAGDRGPARRRAARAG